MGKRCVIFTAYLRGDAQKAYMPREEDIVLCADGGYAHAVRAGITPQRVIGDCDSLLGQMPPEGLLFRAPCEKDDTDTMLCIRHALKLGCEECLVVGGIGGRLDHTYANIQALMFAGLHGMHAEMADEYERVFLLHGSARDICAAKGAILSLFAYSGRCEGVCVSGVKYPLFDAVLDAAFPLGVSNVVTKAPARVSVREGTLLIIMRKA